MSDNPLVKFRRRNSPQESEQDPQQRQENKYNKIQRNDLHAYVQQPKISRNREERNEDQQDYHQEEEEDNSQEKFGGFVFTKSKGKKQIFQGDQKKQQQQYIYEPKNKQPVQQQRREFPQKRDQPPKRKPEKKNSKGSSQQMKEPSKQQLTELEKLQQHLLNCGLAISNQDNQESESILPLDLGKLPLPSQQIVAPPPGLAEKDKSTDFADLLNKLHDDDSDGQLNYEEHFSSSVLPRGTFSQPSGLNQFNNNNNAINNFNSQADQKQKEKKKKNKKKKPKNKNQADLNVINNPPDFYNPNPNSNEFFDPFKATPFSFPQQQMGLNSLPEPLNISGPTLTTPLSFPPQGMMGLGPQIAPFNQNIMGAPPQLGFPLGPNLGMDSMDAPFPMGPNLGGMGPLGMPQMPPQKFNQMQMPPQIPMNPNQPRKKQQKQQQHMMMQPPNFDTQLYCPPMMPNHMQNQFQDFQPPGQPFAPNLMSSGPILGMPPMMQFDNNFEQDWINSDGMLQMPTPIQMYANQNFPNLSQVQHPDAYHDDNNYAPPLQKQTEEKQITEEQSGPKVTGEGQPKQRKYKTIQNQKTKSEFQAILPSEYVNKEESAVFYIKNIIFNTMNDVIQSQVTSQYNIMDTKKKMKDLEDFLAKQFVEYEELQEKKKKQKQRHENAKKQRGNRYSSFANSLHRPQYVTALKESQLFENQSVFVNSNVPFISNIEKSQLISPDRNKNSQPILHKLHRPFNKMDSEFPPLRKRFLSQKEIKRIDFWDCNYNKLKEIETQQKSQMLVGKIKKQILEQKEHLVFKPTDQCLRYFDKHPPLISNFPITESKNAQDLHLPKIIKVWMPNNNYF